MLIINKMKLTRTLLIVIIVIGLVIGLNIRAQSTVVLESSEESIHSFKSNGGTYIISRENKFAEKFADFDAVVSSDSKYLAYTKKTKDNTNFDSKLYIRNLETGVEQTIELENDNIFKTITSWSPNSKFLVVQAKSTSPDAVMTYIYNFTDGSLIKALNNFTYFNFWKDDNLIYIDKPTCIEKCDKYLTNIIRYNPNNNTSQTISTIESSKMVNIDNVNLIDNKLFINISSYNQIPNEKIEIEYQRIKRYYSFDFLTGKIQEELTESSIEQALHNSIIEDNDSYRIRVQNLDLMNSYFISLIPQITGSKQIDKVIQIEDRIILEDYNLIN